VLFWNRSSRAQIRRMPPRISWPNRSRHRLWKKRKARSETREGAFLMAAMPAVEKTSCRSSCAWMKWVQTRGVLGRCRLRQWMKHPGGRRAGKEPYSPHPQPKSIFTQRYAPTPFLPEKPPVPLGKRRTGPGATRRRILPSVRRGPKARIESRQAPPESTGFLPYPSPGPVEVRSTSRPGSGRRPRCRPVCRTSVRGWRFDGEWP